MGVNVPVGFGNLLWGITATGDPEEMVTAIGVELTDTVLPSDIFTLYTDGGWQDFWHLMASSAYSVIRGTVEVGQDGGPPVAVETTFADEGEQSSDALVQNVAYLVKKSTGVGGRKQRGRMYWPGMPNSDVNNVGVVDATVRSDLNSALTAILGALPSGPFSNYVLLHSGSDGPTPITNLTLETTVATQRRRLRP